MRVLSCLAVVLATVACGTSPAESGNVYVTEQALETESMAGAPDGFRVFPVTIDAHDPGCSVDGMRFTSCTITYAPASDFELTTSLCELRVNTGSSYFFDCGPEMMSGPGVEEIEELPMHCPGH
jgi:hypothetical protein